MAKYTDIFKSEKGQNWCRACIALHITRKGIEKLIYDEIKTFKETSMKDINKQNGVDESRSCNRCSTQNVLPCPTPAVCHVRGGKCRFHDSQQNSQKPCPTGICEDMRIRIESRHLYKKPSWKNTNAQEWHCKTWEVAKCYMPPDGYTRVKTAEQTDFNGLISVMLNCSLFQNKLSFRVTKTPNILTKVREIGRDIRHSSTLEVSDVDLQGYFNDIETFLTDPKFLSIHQDTCDALENLRKLKNGQLDIEKNQLSNVVTDALAALKEHEQLSIEKIDKEIIRALEKAREELTDEKLAIATKIQETTDAHLEAAKETIAKHGNEAVRNLEDMYGDIYDDLYQDLAKHIGEAKREISEQQVLALANIETRARLMKKQTRDGTADDTTPSLPTRHYSSDESSSDDEDTDRIGLVNALIVSYQQNLLHDTLDPLLPNETVDIDSVFVPPSLEVTDTSKNVSKPMFSTDDGFGDIETATSKVLLKASGGMGKTMICRHLLSLWCRSRKRKRKSRGLMRVFVNDNKIRNWSIYKMGDFSAVNMATEENETDYACSSVEQNKKAWQIHFKTNMEFVKDADVLFFISLRDFDGKTCLESLIQEQLFHDSGDFTKVIKRVLDEYHDNCAMIIDDIDQTNISDVMRVLFSGKRKSIPMMCTTSTETDNGDNSFRFGRCINVKGYPDSSILCLADTHIRHLNKCLRVHLQLGRFVADVFESKTTDVDLTPSMTKLLVHSWCQSQKGHRLFEPGSHANVLNLLIHSITGQNANFQPQNIPEVEDYGLPIQLAKSDECVKNSRLLVALGIYTLQNFLVQHGISVNARDLEGFGLNEKIREEIIKVGFLKRCSVRSNIKDKPDILQYPSHDFRVYLAALGLHNNTVGLGRLLSACSTEEDLVKCSSIFSVACELDPTNYEVICKGLYLVTKEVGWDKQIQNAVFSCFNALLKVRETPAEETRLRTAFINGTDKEMIERVAPNHLRALVIKREASVQLTDTMCERLMQTNALETFILYGDIQPDEKTALGSLATLDTLFSLILSNVSRDMASHLLFGGQLHVRCLYLTDTKLSHTQITHLLCEQTHLECVSLSAIECQASENCECKNSDKQEVPERMPSVSKVRVLNVSKSPGVFSHVKQLPNLEALTYDRADTMSDKQMLSVLNGSEDIVDLRLANLIIVHSEMSLSRNLHQLKRISMSGAITGNSLKEFVTSFPMDHPALVLDFHNLVVLKEHDSEVREWLEKNANNVSIKEWRKSESDSKLRIVLVINKNIRHPARRCEVRRATAGPGFEIASNADGLGVVVSDICNRESFLQGTVTEGDKILTINNIDMMLATPDVAYKTMEKAGDTFEICLQYDPYAFIPVYHDVCYRRQSWWMDEISFDEVQMVLTVGEVGNFLVWQQEEDPALTLSVRCKEDVTAQGYIKHHKIWRDSTGWCFIDPSFAFPTVYALISCYGESSHGLGYTLDEPCVVDKRMIPIYRLGDKMLQEDYIELKNKIGQGHYSEVFLGSLVDVYDDDKVAVKVIKDATQGGHALDELIIHSELRHQNIVKFIGACLSAEDSLWIVTELVSGGSLLTHLRLDRGATVSYQMLINFAKQICDGMAYLESNHILHRDLRADNILLEGKTVVKIADFGLAHKLKNDKYITRSGPLQFPIKWTAPEAVLYMSFNAKSDVWSFGVLLFELITFGAIPYQGMSRREVVKKLDNGYRMPAPLGCPYPCTERYYNTMLDCWQKDPDDRPTFAALLEAFKAYKTELIGERHDDMIFTDEYEEPEDDLSFRQKSIQNGQRGEKGDDTDRDDDNTDTDNDEDDEEDDSDDDDDGDGDGDDDDDNDDNDGKTTGTEAHNDHNFERFSLSNHETKLKKIHINDKPSNNASLHTSEGIDKVSDSGIAELDNSVTCVKQLAEVDDAIISTEKVENQGTVGEGVQVEPEIQNLNISSLSSETTPKGLFSQDSLCLDSNSSDTPPKQLFSIGNSLSSTDSSLCVTETLPKQEFTEGES